MKTLNEDAVSIEHCEKQSRLSKIRNDVQNVTAQIAEESVSIEGLKARIQESRVEELVEGNAKNSESLEVLQITLADKCTELLKLQDKLVDLAMAETKLAKLVAELERQLNVQAAQRTLTDYRAAVASLRDILVKAEVANDRLAALDRELRQSQLAEFGGKPLILISRSGLSWNALAPIPIVGSPVHFRDWLANVDRLLGE